MEVSVLPKPKKVQVMKYTKMFEPTVAAYRTDVKVVLVPLSAEQKHGRPVSWLYSVEKQKKLPRLICAGFF
jgi:hypothetical protein